MLVNSLQLYEESPAAILTNKYICNQDIIWFKIGQGCLQSVSKACLCSCPDWKSAALIVILQRDFIVICKYSMWFLQYTKIPIRCCIWVLSLNGGIFKILFNAPTGTLSPSNIYNTPRNFVELSEPFTLSLLMVYPSCTSISITVSIQF